MVLDLLRQMLIDFALDSRDKEMFRRLTSADWRQYVVSSTDIPTPSVVAQPQPIPQRYVLFESKADIPLVCQFPDVPDAIAFTVEESRFDTRGWRDMYGYTFYDRLRSAGYRMATRWKEVPEIEFDRLLVSYKVIRPWQLILHHPRHSFTVSP